MQHCALKVRSCYLTSKHCKIFKTILCLIQDDPPPKTGYAVGNSTNMSATYTDSRKVGPTNGVQKSGRTKSGKAKNDRVEEAEIDGDFQ